LHRLRGVFLAALGADGAQIEVSFCSAIRIAKEQKSVSLEKRTEGTYVEYRRIDLISHENIDEMTQCRNRSIQHVRSATVIDDRAVSLQIDFEGRKRPAPIFGRCD
jgi:hypothetical protein